MGQGDRQKEPRVGRQTVVDVVVADSLLNALSLALTQALGDVFTVLWIAVALSFAVAWFMRARRVNGQRD